MKMAETLVLSLSLSVWTWVRLYYWSLYRNIYLNCARKTLCCYSRGCLVKTNHHCHKTLQNSFLRTTSDCCCPLSYSDAKSTNLVLLPSSFWWSADDVQLQGRSSHWRTGGSSGVWLLSLSVFAFDVLLSVLRRNACFILKVLFVGIQP